MLAKITVTYPPTTVSVTFGGLPYRVTFTGKIEIGCFADTLVFRGESDDASMEIQEDRENLERDREFISDIPNGAVRRWGIPRNWYPLYSGSITTGVDYISDLIESAREEERERCAKLAEDAHRILAAGIGADDILIPKFQEIRRKHGEYIATRIRKPA